MIAAASEDASGSTGRTESTSTKDAKAMRELPQRPDLDQLRRQARELHRAAARGGARVRLSELGAPQGGAVARPPPHPALLQRGREPSIQVRTWQGMRDSSANLLQRLTGRNLDDWNRRIARRRFSQPGCPVQMARRRGGDGVPAAAACLGTLRLPSFMTAGADDLISRQYVDRAQLRPILDATLAALPGIGPVAVVQARKTYISLVSKRRTFAVIQATTRNRVDLGLRLGNQRPGGRLKPGKGVGNGSMTVCLPLSAVADLDDEALSWLKRAYDENA